MEVCWLRAAVQERDALLDYIAEDNPQAAFRLHGRIMEAVDRLREFPRSGPILRERVRACFVQFIRIEYIVKKTSVVVLGVFHSARPSKR